MAATKNIVVDLNKDEKFAGDNYNIWHCKEQMVVEDQEVFEVSDDTLWEMEKKYSLARIMIVKAIDNNLLCEYEKYANVRAM